MDRRPAASTPQRLATDGPPRVARRLLPSLSSRPSLPHLPSQLSASGYDKSSLLSKSSANDDAVLGLDPAERDGGDSRLHVVLAERLLQQEIPGLGEDVVVRVVGQCDGHAVCLVRRCGQRSLTIASVMPSYPLAPTVWRVVAATRSSRDRRSCKRRTPRTLGSVFASSTRAPSRTTLSSTISVPGLE